MISIGFITLEYARLQVHVEDREHFDDQLRGMIWLASQQIAKHIKIDDIPDGTGNFATWYSLTPPDVPEDYILPQQLDTSSPPVLSYVIPPGTIQQATALLVAEMFMNREAGATTGLTPAVLDLLEGYRDPTVA